MQQGWIKLYRQIQECFLWQDKPFNRKDAWIDLLLSANHDDKTTLFNGKSITIKRGQYLTSIRKLAERWGWSNDRTVRFLILLESEQMIERDSDNNRTLLTIVNYAIYQGDTDSNKYTDEYSNEYTDRTLTSTPAEHSQVQSQGTNKNIKNEKNEKNERSNKEKDIPIGISKEKVRFVPPTVDEVRAYCIERNNNVDAQSFIDFYESKGWMVGKNKMKDWKASVRTWEKNDNQKGRQSSGNAYIDKIEHRYDVADSWLERRNRNDG